MEPGLLWVSWLGLGIKMTKDDIIRMAREAGFNHPSSEKDTDYYKLDRFAALVAAAEREACWDAAGIALLGADRDLTKRVLKAIAARGQQ